MKDFYVRWRQGFVDYAGWFTFSGVRNLIEQVKLLEGKGEAEIYIILEGTQCDESRFIPDVSKGAFYE